jgi:DNA-binding MarR family transcriptional regulator
MKRSLVLEEYFPFYLGTIANRWTAASSRTYLAEFGMGIGEWRVLASLHALGQASGQEVVNLIAMDPGAVSRAIAKLEHKQFIAPAEGRFAGRTKPFDLTAGGKEIYNSIARLALERAEFLLADLTEDERHHLFSALRKLRQRSSEL